MIGAKIDQAVGILNELDIDVWMLFARESATVHDPSFDLVVGGNCTWQSAFILTRKGERIAILGSLDVAAHTMLGHYTEIVPYVKGVSEPLREVLRRLDPGASPLLAQRRDGRRHDARDVPAAAGHPQGHPFAARLEKLGGDHRPAARLPQDAARGSSASPAPAPRPWTSSPSSTGGCAST